MHCRFELTHPPRFSIEPRIARDPVLRQLEATWQRQQLPVAFILSTLDGLPWILWGICLRITLSLTGHWAVSHIAHDKGKQS